MASFIENVKFLFAENFVFCYSYFSRPNIFLHMTKSKQDHDTDLKWLPEYLKTNQRDAKKIIVYCKYIFLYSIELATYI